MPMARRSKWAGRSSSTISPRRRPSPAFTAPSPVPRSLALGLVAGCQLAGLKMFFGSYPITPASPLLHHLARLKEFGITTFQAEDEIAAICAAIGASYAGQLGITSSSGPGIALKMEAMGLAVMTELPLVIVNSQRGGPSTGLPTKTEQSTSTRRLRPQRRTPVPVIARVRPPTRSMRDRGVPHRYPLHDPGNASDRRLYRQRSRAMARARHDPATNRSRRRSSTRDRRKARA